MRLVKIGVGCVSPRVGDLSGNRELLEQLIDRARDEGVTLLVTPELGISGYSLGDRVLWDDFPDRCFDEVERLAARCADIDVFVGTPVPDGSRIYNGLALVSNTKVVGITLKQFLPNYGIFYEGRQWTGWSHGATRIRGLPAGELLFRLDYGIVGAEICEDAWSVNAPSRRLALHGAEIIVNGSASPFTAGKQARRRRIVAGAADALMAAYAYANLLGCDSSRLVFDGGGMIAAPGHGLTEGARLGPEAWTLTTAVVDLDALESQRTANSTWRTTTQHAAPDPTHPELVTVDRVHKPLDATEAPVQPGVSYFLPTSQPTHSSTADLLDEILDALALGVRDYFVRAGAFDRILVALSGGRDSALTLVAAWRAMATLPPRGEGGNGADEDPAGRIACRYLPTRQYSSADTRLAAVGLACELGVEVNVISIQEEFDLAQQVLARMVGDTAKIQPLALENAQARIRGAMMLNWANCVRGLVLVTSNMSEFAVGYFTTGGDNQGGFAPISGIPKTLVNQLLERAAERWSLSSIEAILALAPSAELSEDQSDEAELMPYPVLDDILFLFAADRRTPVDVWRLACTKYPDEDPERLRGWVAQFVRLFAQNQWKRDQSPVGLKMLDLDLDPTTGFRFPVLQSLEDDLARLAKATPT
jgi:NAD+ synthase (glutamine-hydrolysing)